MKKQKRKSKGGAIQATAVAKLPQGERRCEHQKSLQYNITWYASPAASGVEPEGATVTSTSVLVPPAPPKTARRAAGHGDAFKLLIDSALAFGEAVANAVYDPTDEAITHSKAAEIRLRLTAVKFRKSLLPAEGGTNNQGSQPGGPAQRAGGR